MTSNLNVLSVGGSRNIGYFSSIRLLDAGAKVTFLLRSPGVFDKDEVIQKYVISGKAHLIKGDALVRADVEHAWNIASKENKVDLLLFTVGGIPKFTLLHGFAITPANLVTQSLINVLSTMPKSSDPGSQTRVVTISSTGLTRTSHAALPLALKPLYGYLLQLPHKDKVGAERVIAHCAGWNWNTEQDGEPGEDILGEGDWTQGEGLPAPGELRRVLIIRPALLLDGECVGEKAEKQAKEGKVVKKPYRVSEEELGGWTISRKDVAHFLVDAVLNRWDEYENKCVNIAY